jgi:hypothetical protein
MIKKTGVVAALALFAAACGGGDEHHVRAESQTLYQQAVAFAKCMRANGHPAWPDPGSDGAFPNNNGSLDKTSAAFKKASAACKTLQPTGEAPAADIQQDFNQFLKFSACMRAHGIAKFPDPVREDHGVGLEIPKSVDEKSPQYKAALDACRSLQPGGGQ